MSEEHPGNGGSTGKAGLDAWGRGKSFSLGDGWSTVLGFGVRWRPEAAEEAGAW